MSRKNKNDTHNKNKEKKKTEERPPEDEKEAPAALPKNYQKICSICYEIIKEAGIIECCSHDFCFDCINKWSKVYLLKILN